MAWTQATINNLKPTDKNYKKQEDNLVVMITPAGSITYYAYIRRNLEYLGTHPELTLRNAKKKKLDMFADMYMGKHEESKMTFEEFVFSNDFQEWSIGHRKTHVARMNSMKATILPKLGKVKLAKINKVDINRYKNARLKEGVKHSTINRELSDISGVLTQAFEMEYINLPIKVQKFPEDRGKERRVLDDWEVKALRDSAHSIEGLNTRQAKQKKHIGLIIDIALWCGLRKGEILKLRWGDIVHKGSFVKDFKKTLPADLLDEDVWTAFTDSAFSDYAFRIRGETAKTKQTRLVPIAKDLLFELFTYYAINVGLKSPDYLEKYLQKARDMKADGIDGGNRTSEKDLEVVKIATEDKELRIFPYNNVDNSFNTARDNAGVDRDITLHSLRHHFCSKALESGMSLHCVKDLAGHASITTTEIYLHTNHRLKFEQYQKLERSYSESYL